MVLRLLSGSRDEVGRDGRQSRPLADLELAQRLRRLAQRLDELPRVELAGGRLDERQQLSDRGAAGGRIRPSLA